MYRSVRALTDSNTQIKARGGGGGGGVNIIFLNFHICDRDAEDKQVEKKSLSFTCNY